MNLSDFWRLTVVFLIFALVADSLGWRSWGRRIRGKIPRLVKGKPFTLMISGGDPEKSFGSPKRSGGLLSRIRGAIRRPKTTKTATKHSTRRRNMLGIFGKEMLEPTEGSGVSIEANNLPGEYSNQNETLDDVLSRVSTSTLHSRRREEYRSMIEVQIEGVRYKMLFDTGSPWGMIPEEGCAVTAPEKYKCGRDNNVYTPPPNEDKSQLIKAEPGGYSSPDPSIEPPAFSGYQRSGQMVINGVAINVDFATADVMTNMPFPMMGASPRIMETNLAYQILEQTNEPLKRFTTFLRTPEVAGINAPNGNVVFGGIDPNLCRKKIVWMARDSSLRLWRLTFNHISIGRKSTGYREVWNDEQQAIADTGSLYFAVKSPIYERIVDQLRAATGNELTESQITNNGRSFPVMTLPCTFRPFFVMIQVCQATHGNSAPKCHLIPMRSWDFTRPLKSDPTVCEFMIKDAGMGSNLLGVPFYRSVCIIHDYDAKRLGFALMKTSARRIRSDSPTPSDAGSV